MKEPVALAYTEMPARMPAERLPDCRGRLSMKIHRAIVARAATSAKTTAYARTAFEDCDKYNIVVTKEYDCLG